LLSPVILLYSVTVTQNKTSIQFNSKQNKSKNEMSTTAATNAAADADTVVLVPKPDKIIKYKTVCNNESVLYLYGSEKSEKIAILCAGFPDDHTVFQSFACELAKQGNTFVGIMCLPGYDDRPNDGMPWTSHRSDGYTFNDWSNSIRDAVKALRAESTFIGGVEKTKFTGIFHGKSCLLSLVLSLALVRRSLSFLSFVIHTSSDGVSSCTSLKSYTYLRLGSRCRNHLVESYPRIIICFSSR
jgi:hypothetical protein